MDFNKIAFQIPTDLETFTIETKQGDLIIREPVACDFALVESIGKSPNIHERTFALALRLAVSLNGVEGVTAIDLGKLDRKAYKELVNMMSEFFLSIVPDFAENLISKYIRDEQQQLPGAS